MSNYTYRIWARISDNSGCQHIILASVERFLFFCSKTSAVTGGCDYQVGITSVGIRVLPAANISLETSTYPRRSIISGNRVADFSTAQLLAEHVR